MSSSRDKQRTKKKRKVKGTACSLPDRLLIIPNQDKMFHETWHSGRNKLNIPHPFRACLVGPPNSGKTLVTKNIILRAKPAFERIIVIHGLGETQEYDDILCDTEDEDIHHELPPMSFLENINCKALIILDDIDFKGLDKDQQHILNRLYGTLSTHKNISVISSTQDFFQMRPLARRCSNFMIIWRPYENSGISRIAPKCGLSAGYLKKLFVDHCKDKHDSVWIDKTEGTPYPIRINGFHIPQRSVPLL